MHHFEAAIIGGGPAGSSAAIQLKNYGFSVCLIEKKNFPRETLCGEFLSVEVISTLKAFGIEKDFLNLNPNPVSSVSFINDNGAEINSELKFPAYGVKRSTFDHFLINYAKKCGTVLFQPAEVLTINKSNNNFTLHVKENGNQYTINADFVIAAYGKQNILDKHISRLFISHMSGINGVKFHFPISLFKDYPKNHLYVYTTDDIYCGVNAVNDDQITFCFLENHKKLNNPPFGQLRHLAGRNSKFSELLQNLPLEKIRESRLYGTGNIFFGKKEKVVNGIYMIGDAAGVIAPLAGDGIGMAAESAFLLAEVLNNVKNKKITRDESYNLYAEKWDQQYIKRLRTALIVQRLFLSPGSRNTVYLLAKLFPGLTRLIIKNTRSRV